MSLFGTPNQDEDKKALEDEKKHRGSIDWSAKFWKPKPEAENRIRILPQRSGTKFPWHIRAAKHFIKHEDKTESFICLQETYGQPCPACEKQKELNKAGKKEEARAYAPRRFGVFNVVDRNDPASAVKLYEAPIKAVWERIVTLKASGGRLSNLFDVIDEKTGKVIRHGRDIIIEFNPNTTPQYMYGVYPDDPSTLGEKEQQEKWAKEMVDLIPENLYPPIEYEWAYVKTFGDQKEREKLREALRAQNSGSQVQAAEPEEEEAVAQEAPAPEPEPEPEPEKPKTTKAATSASDSDDYLKKIKDKVAQVRKSHPETK